MDYSRNINNVYALRIKNLNGATKDYPVDRETYIQHVDSYAKLYCKTIVFKTLEGSRVRGILDNVVCTLDLER